MASAALSFRSEGVDLAARHYPARGVLGPRPVVVMAHGFSAVMAQLEPQALRFSAAGYHVLAFDHAGFGLSGGDLRQEVDPERQLRGYRDAVTFARGLPGVDPMQVALWGSSYSGGHVLKAAAVDPRVGCVISQAPFISGSRLLALRSDYEGFMEALTAEREARSAGADPTLIPVVAPRNLPSALPGDDGFAWFTATGGPTWRNEVTLSSFELARGYEPGWWIEQIAPRPLLMIVAADDTVTPTAHAEAAFARASGPKHLEWVEGGHFAVYSDGGFETAMAASIGWLRNHFR